MLLASFTSGASIEVILFKIFADLVNIPNYKIKRLPWWLNSEEFTCNAGDSETWIQSLSQEDSLEEDVATHSSNLAWKIP